MTIEEFYQICDNLSAEYTNAFLSSDDKKWTGEKMACYSFGPVVGMIRENHSAVMDMLNHEADKSLIVDMLQKAKLKNDIECEEMSIQVMGKEKYEQLKAKGRFDFKYPELTTDSILLWMEKYNQTILDVVSGRPDQEKLMFLQLYFGYMQYREKKEKQAIFDQDGIKEIYAEVLPKESDYGKYGLIPVGEDRKVFAMDPPRIFDRVQNKTVCLVSGKSVVKILMELFDNGLIGKYSFRGDNYRVYDGWYDEEYLCEEIEYGLQFSLKIDELRDVAKLYSTETDYHDQLWVIKTDTDLTFEELSSNMDEIESGEYIMTQMIHLKYYMDDGEYRINHIDHEFIYYTAEEFEQRKNDASVKGSAHTRIKTFKVDNAKIPFNYSCEVFDVTKKDQELHKKNVPFIFFIINAHFKHKDILEECFAGMLKDDDNVERI